MTPHPLPFVGIDDFAFKKRFTYGTLFINLETHKPVDMLDTREATDVTEWLCKYPAIKLITRDGSKTYAGAVTEASPAILQVADRWHLLRQLFESTKKSIYSVLPAKWCPPSPNEPDANEEELSRPVRKSDVSRIKNEEKRWERIKEVQALFQEGYSIAAIQRKLGISRGTIYADLRQTDKPTHQRTSTFGRFRPLIRSLIQEERAVEQIETFCRTQGYQGSLSTLNALVAGERRELRKKKPATISVRQKVLHIIWDFKIGKHRDRIGKLHPALPEMFPQLIQLDELVHSFRELFREKASENLAEWIEQYKQCDFPLVQSFIEGIRQDFTAVQASIEEPWSNGPMEGQINRLKTIKRMMYGRASFHILRNRVLYQWQL